MNVDSSSILLRPSEFFQQYGIDVWTQKEVRSQKDYLSCIYKDWCSLWSCEEICFVLQVVSVNTDDKKVKLSDGTLQNYDQLLISTGCRLAALKCHQIYWTQKTMATWKGFHMTTNSECPYLFRRARPLSCPGSDLKGVKLLESYEDAKEIHNSSLGQKAVVIGSSFIGY